MRISKHRVNVELVDNGVWWNFQTKATCPGNVPHDTDGCFLVVPNVSGRYMAQLAEEQRPYAEVLRKKPPADSADAADHRAIVQSITRKCRAIAMGKTSLRGWANLEDDDDNPMVWTEEAGIELLSERANLVFLDFIEQAAFNVEALMAEEEAKAEGN